MVLLFNCLGWKSHIGVRRAERELRLEPESWETRSCLIEVQSIAWWQYRMEKLGGAVQWAGFQDGVAERVSTPRICMQRRSRTPTQQSRFTPDAGYVTCLWKSPRSGRMLQQGPGIWGRAAWRWWWLRSARLTPFHKQEWLGRSGGGADLLYPVGPHFTQTRHSHQALCFLACPSGDLWRHSGL